MITKSADAHWQGSLKEGRGTISSDSGALKGHPYGFATRFEGQRGTNPEELIGAAHAACFSMALSGVLTEAGIIPDSIDTRSSITMEKQDIGFTVTRAHLTTTIKATGDPETILAAAEKAKANCPISRLLKAEITLDATVAD